MDSEGGNRVIVRYSVLAHHSSVAGEGKVPSSAENDKLCHQFRYFRESFYQLAVAAAIPVPLVLIEDQNGRLFTFIRHDGLKFVLDTLVNNGEHTALVSVGLSLLLVSVNMLCSKIAESVESKVLDNSGNHAHGNHHDSKHLNIITHHRGTGHAHLKTHSHKTHGMTWQWASHSLHGFCQAGAISDVISVLTATIVPSVHEQCVALLALLVQTVPDAAHHVGPPAPHRIPHLSIRALAH